MPKPILAVVLVLSVVAVLALAYKIYKSLKK